MSLTVKENGVRVANPSFKGTIVDKVDIRCKYETLLGELGFNLLQRLPKMNSYVQGSTLNMTDSQRLIVVWKEEPLPLTYTLSIQRGDFVKNHKVSGKCDLYEFISTFLVSVRDVWTEGGKQRCAEIM